MAETVKIIANNLNVLLIYFSSVYQLLKGFINTQYKDFLKSVYPTQNPLKREPFQLALKGFCYFISLENINKY